MKAILIYSIIILIWAIFTSRAFSKNVNSQSVPNHPRWSYVGNIRVVGPNNIFTVQY